MALVTEHIDHLGEGGVGQLEHLVDALILLVCELLLALVLPVDGACHVVATVTDTLYFRDLTEHGTDLAFGVIAQMGVAHLIQVFGNLYLHVVGYSLVFLDTGIQLAEILLILLVQQLADHGKHTVDALAEAPNLLLCLQNGKLRSLHDASLDETQTEILILTLSLGFDEITYNLLNLWDEPNQYGCVANVEASMEHRQDHRKDGCLLCCSQVALWVVTHQGTYQSHEGIEQAKHPEDTEHIEHQVCQGGSACLGIGTECCEVGCGCGTDVLAHHQGYT